MKKFIIATIVIIVLSTMTFIAWGGFTGDWGFGFFFISLVDILLITMVKNKYLD